MLFGCMFPVIGWMTSPPISSFRSILRSKLATRAAAHGPWLQRRWLRMQPPMQLPTNLPWSRIVFLYATWPYFNQNDNAGTSPHWLIILHSLALLSTEIVQVLDLIAIRPHYDLQDHCILIESLLCRPSRCWQSIPTAIFFVHATLLTLDAMQCCTSQVCATQTTSPAACALLVWFFPLLQGFICRVPLHSAWMHSLGCVDVALVASDCSAPDTLLWALALHSARGIASLPWTNWREALDCKYIQCKVNHRDDRVVLSPVTWRQYNFVTGMNWKCLYYLPVCIDAVVSDFTRRRNGHQLRHCLSVVHCFNTKMVEIDTCLDGKFPILSSLCNTSFVDSIVIVKWCPKSEALECIPLQYVDTCTQTHTPRKIAWQWLALNLPTRYYEYV